MEFDCGQHNAVVTSKQGPFCWETVTEWYHSSDGGSVSSVNVLSFTQLLV